MAYLIIMSFIFIAGLIVSALAVTALTFLFSNKKHTPKPMKVIIHD